MIQCKRIDQWSLDTIQQRKEYNWLNRLRIYTCQLNMQHMKHQCSQQRKLNKLRRTDYRILMLCNQWGSYRMSETCGNQKFDKCQARKEYKCRCLRRMQVQRSSQRNKKLPTSSHSVSPHLIFLFHSLIEQHYSLFHC
jgi:hypothetical protein